MTTALEEKLNSALAILEDCVEDSIAIRKENPKLKARVNDQWEQFLGCFLDYIRRRERESGEDLLKGISLAKLFKFW